MKTIGAIEQKYKCQLTLAMENRYDNF